MGKWRGMRPGGILSEVGMSMSWVAGVGRRFPVRRLADVVSGWAARRRRLAMSGQPARAWRSFGFGHRRAAGGAVPVVLQCVEQGQEASAQLSRQRLIVHGAHRQGDAAPTEHTGEVVGVVIDRRVEGLASGQQATAHQAPLLQPAHLAIDRGQSDALVALTQPVMEILAAQFSARIA